MSFPSPLGPSLRPLLRRIGLEEKEIEVYLALIPLPVSRVTAIAKAAKQSRSHTYLVLRSLETRGLVSEVERGGVLHFVAESPRRLLTYVQDRETEIKSLKPLIEGALPYLQSLTAPIVREPSVKLLHGIDGMKQVYREIFPNPFCALFNPASMYHAFGTGIPQLILKESDGLKGRDLLVDNASAERFIRENPQSPDYAIRLLPQGVTFATDTMVFGDIMVILAYDSENTILRIENQNIADSFRAWFEMLWAACRRV